MKKLLFVLLALTLLLTACSGGEPAVTDPPEPEVDLEAVETLLESDPLYRLILSSSFSSVEELPHDWKGVLCYFAQKQGESKAFGTLNSKVREELKESFPSANVNTDFFRLSAETAVQEMERRLGIALTENELEGAGFIYCAADGYYYTGRAEHSITSDGWFSGYDAIEVDTVVLLEDGTVEVCYRPQSSVYTEIYGKAVLRETDGAWVVHANEIEIPMLNTDADPVEPGNLNADTLAQFRILLESDWYRNALTSFYSSPVSVNLHGFFGRLPREMRIDRSKLTEEEIAYYEELCGDWFSRYDSYAISSADVDAVLAQVFGMTLIDTPGQTIPGLTYDPRQDVYIQINGTGEASFELQYGIRNGIGEGRTVELYYTDGGEDLCVITLRDTGDGWEVVSNLPVDPFGAMDDSNAGLWEEITNPESWLFALLATEFADWEEIDPRIVFANQPSSELTDAEKEFLSGIWGEDTLSLDVVRVPADELDAVLREHTYGSLEGLDLKDDDPDFPYFPETDCYYLARGALILEPSDVELLYCDDFYEQGPAFHYLRYSYEEYVIQFRCLDETKIVSNLPVGEPTDEEFVRVADYIPSIRQELAYATENNFTGQQIYDFTEAYLHYGTVKKLMLVCEELAEQGIGLIVWDAFRPVSAQAKLWEICPDPAFVSHPVTGKRGHCRGNTLDVSLYDLNTGEELPVPTGYDDFTARADRDYSDCSPEAAANALLLEQTMEKYGFSPYFAEWWQFSDTVDYPVAEYFDPADN